MSLLELDSVEASYGESQALFGVSLAVDAGQVLAVLGRNGMGKSSTIKVISRLLKHSAGRVQFGGADLARMPPHKAARAGLGLVPEGRRCFPNLTVRENLIAAARPGDWTLATVADLFPRLEERQSQMASTLSGGEQQMLAIGRALMTNPRLLMLDEATEGLAPTVWREIWDALAKLKNATGLSLIVIDKSLAELRGIADQAVILERGKSVWAGDISDLTAENARTYLGL